MRFRCILEVLGLTWVMAHYAAPSRAPRLLRELLRCMLAPSPAPRLLKELSHENFSLAIDQDDGSILIEALLPPITGTALKSLLCSTTLHVL
jgi:hypothetical protein